MIKSLNMENKKLSTAPYKGTSDMYPEDVLKRNYLFNIWTRVAKQFGYEEYDTPLLEEANLYRVKSGEEIANTQLYNFVDKGGREVALRPEMTPSLARIIAARQNELTLPLRWFNIGRYYRYEKPQRGRTREFFQLNIDLLGINTIEAELEIFQFIMEVMKELKAPKNTFELKVNNRYLLEYLFKDVLNLTEDQKGVVAKAIDKYLKMEESEFFEYLKELGLTTVQVEKLSQYLKWELQDLEEIKDKSQGAQQLLELFDKAKKLGLENIKFSPYIVRGLAYYTGTVIEMYDVGSKENPRALFGGGRYDDLLDIFGKEKLPAFGLGWGDVTTLDFLSTYNLLPELKTETEVLVTLMSKELYFKTNELVQYLRDNGINTQIQIEPIKLGNQLKYADRKKIPWVIIMGEEELEKNVVQLKNMVSRDSVLIKKEDIVQKIKQ
jgi:histidyl-tRNA synthetase